MSRKKTSVFSISLGGVALADILANSVAVILIMIIITITVQQKRAEDEVSQNASVTTILARQLASTIVFNDLPSSPPARLHDYHSCEIPHDCNPHLFPIVELHKGYIRIFNTNTRLYRNELLRTNNAFDTYIKILPPQHAARIRIDVYDVSEYYLALGILQEHKIRPRHWHYLGNHVEPLKNPLVAEKAVGGGQNFNPDQFEEVDNAGQSGQLVSEQNNGSAQGSEQQTANADQGMETVPADFDTLATLQYDSLLPPTDEAGGQSSQDQLQQSDQSSQQGSANTEQTPSTLFEALVGMMAESRGLTGQSGQGSSNSSQGQRSMRLHAPNVESNTQQQGQDQKQSIELPPEQYTRVVLTFLFRMLTEARAEKTFALPQARNFLQEIAQNYDAINSLPYADLVNELAEQLDAGVANSHPQLSSIKYDAAHGNQLLIGFNKPLGQQGLRLSNPFPNVEDLLQQAEVQPQFLMRLYPSLFKGEVLDVPAGYTVLLLPDEVKKPEEKWRPIAVLDHTVSDISLGFVYAGIAEEKLAIVSGVNQLRLNNTPIANPIISDRDKSQSTTPLVWLLAAILLLFLLVRIYNQRYATL